MPGLKPTLIFLEASHSALVRRFSETRRPHPLAPDRSVAEGITEERGKLNAIRAMADLILDTSNLTVHELRDIFMQMSPRQYGQGRHGGQPGQLRMQEWGAAWTPDLVFDVRCLPNPYFVDASSRAHRYVTRPSCVSCERTSPRPSSSNG